MKKGCEIMFLIAHRGHTKYAPENTKEAVLAALDSSSIIGVEFDVRMTKDKQFVLSHDDSLKRVFKVNKKVSKLTLDEIKEIEYHGFSIPTLESVLKEVRTNKLLLIEMKIKGDNYQDYVNRFYQIIKRYSYLNIIVISFNGEALDYLSKLSNALKLGFLAHKLPSTLPPFTALALNYQFLNSTIINRVIKEGRYLFVWTIKHASDIQKLEPNLNKLFIITDMNTF